MKTILFKNLIQAITGRDLMIKTDDEDILNEKEYLIFRTLPITERTVFFTWKTAKTDEKLLKSFITAFTSKYREPNPEAYDWSAKIYGEKHRWINMSERDREYAYMHHSSNMFSKEKLLQQVQDNFSNPNIEQSLVRFGFYTTEYGIGIFAFWETQYVVNAINRLKKYLNEQNIPFCNEYSDARWVYRFKLNISKDVHNNLLQSFN